MNARLRFDHRLLRSQGAPDAGAAQPHPAELSCNPLYNPGRHIRPADRSGGEGFPAGVRVAPDRCGGFSHLVRNFPYLCGSFQNRGAFLKQEGFSPFNQPSSCLLLMHKGGTDTFYRIRTALFSLYSSKVLMASMVSVIRSSRLQPSISAPCSITSREQGYIFIS